jgi:hypothetical protein
VVSVLAFPFWDLLARRTIIFRRLVVLLDHLAPRQGAFQQALEWAGRWQLPLHGICAPSSYSSNGAKVQAPITMLDHILVANGLGREACAEEGGCRAVCKDLGIRWECSPWRETAAGAVRQLAEPGDLLIFGQAFRANQKQGALNKHSLHDFPAVLVCPDQHTAISRVLILNKQVDGDHGFLTRAAQLCASLQAFPIVLTVARSVREAQIAQRSAQMTLLEQQVQADFDCVVGSEVRLAVAKVAHWRRCQLVMMERRLSKPWWRWMRTPYKEQLMDLSQSFALLAFLAEGLFESVATENASPPCLEPVLSRQRKNPPFQKAVLRRSPDDGEPND